MHFSAFHYSINYNYYSFSITAVACCPIYYNSKSYHSTHTKQVNSPAPCEIEDVETLLKAELVGAAVVASLCHVTHTKTVWGKTEAVVRPNQTRHYWMDDSLQKNGVGRGGEKEEAGGGGGGRRRRREEEEGGGRERGRGRKRRRRRRRRREETATGEEKQQRKRAA